MSNNIYKNHIKNFDFARPNFSWLPNNPNEIEHSGLSCAEIEILNCIKYQHSITKYLAEDHNFILRGFIRLSFSGVILGGFSLVFVMFFYYINVNLNLGMNFLTDFFA